MSGGTRAGAQDYTIERVDGGGRSDPITDRQVHAVLKIDEARTLLGPGSSYLVVQTCASAIF